GLTAMKQEDVKKLYVEREREPDMTEPGKWMPKDKGHL
ncbi:MAG: 4Fe-4S ferredoxin, partial [Deltaproteobacteria bacterium]|nr:4Fe-4S ferredoxin [Deltaproteobacteria bacterium]